METASADPGACSPGTAQAQRLRSFLGRSVHPSDARFGGSVPGTPDATGTDPRHALGDRGGSSPGTVCEAAGSGPAVRLDRTGDDGSAPVRRRSFVRPAGEGTARLDGQPDRGRAGRAAVAAAPGSRGPARERGTYDGCGAGGRLLACAEEAVDDR